MGKVVFKYRPPNGAPGAPQRPASNEFQPSRPPDGKPVDRWWHESSYDLRRGLDVNDDFGETVPGDLLDELFKR